MNRINIPADPDQKGCHDTVTIVGYGIPSPLSRLLFADFCSQTDVSLATLTGCGILLLYT